MAALRCSSSCFLAGFPSREFHGQPTFSFAFMIWIQPDACERTHDLFTMVKEEAASQERGTGASGQRLSQIN